MSCHWIGFSSILSLDQKIQLIPFGKWDHYMREFRATYEEMVPVKDRLNVKQYVKNKSNLWRIKMFALCCGRSSLLFDFVIYQEREWNRSFWFGWVFGYETLSRNYWETYRSFFWYFFSWNYNVLEFLRNQVIYASCTARIERLKHSPFMDDENYEEERKFISQDEKVIL